MADIFDIDSRSNTDNYDNYRGHNWSENNRKDPRLNRHDNSRNMNVERATQMYDKLGVPISPVRKRYSRSPSPRRNSRGRHRRSSERSSPSPPRRQKDNNDGWQSPRHLQNQQMYSQSNMQQSYQPQPPPPPIYQPHEGWVSNQENSRSAINFGWVGYNTSSLVKQENVLYSTSYPPSVTSYQQNYYPTSQAASTNYGQYNTTTSYPTQSAPPPPPPPNYNSGATQQPGPPGDEYPGQWAPVSQASYPNLTHPPPPVARPTPPPTMQQQQDTKKDNLKKEAIANEMKQQQATLVKQRDEYLRKSSVLRRELEKLRIQKQDLLSEKSPPRDSERVLRENAKLQLEIQNKLKSINNVVDMLSGIIGDGLKMKDEEISTIDSPKRLHKQDSTEDEEIKRKSADKDSDQPFINYVHYDPELHWCRVCDVFPRTAKDLLNHMHNNEHRQVTQERQLVDTPWHKLPVDQEFPSFKGAPVKRVPIKGLQFFIPATAWYCKLCDTWIGDLHCASLHLKSKNHSQNFAHFIDQNPHWETNWFKDREKAFERCGKLKLNSEEDVPPAPEPPSINEKLKRKKHKDTRLDLSFIDSSKEKKRKKKSKKRKKVESSGSSSSSSSSDSSSEEDSDKSKSIRVAMRNKMRLQAQMILKEEMEGKLEVLGRIVEESNRKKEKLKELEEKQDDLNNEDNIINQWMTVSNNSSNDKHILEGLKGRLKQRQEADKEKIMEAAIEQRKREREREERELKEIREREQKEKEAKLKEEQEKLEREREERERERIKERNRHIRRHSTSSSDERYPSRSRSRSTEKRPHRPRDRSQERHFRRGDRRYSPETDKYRHKEKSYDSRDSKSNKDKKSSSNTNRKLPFIGRMPLFKKKGDGEEKEIKKEEYEIRPTKFEAVNSVKAFIPAPGVVHITKLATPPDPINMIKINAENPPPPPKIIPEPPKISNNDDENIAPPPPIITQHIMEHEMELDENPVVPLPPGVQLPEGKPLAKPAGEHLPRDFQEALNIIFPGDQHPDHLAMQQDPNLMMQYQYEMGYGMMYPWMHQSDASNQQLHFVSKTPAGTVERENKTEKGQVKPPPPPCDDDLAMLGIDAEDMAAQTI